MFKQAGKINAENKDKGLHSDDDDEPRHSNTGGQKKFPPQVKTVNMIYTTHIPNGSEHYGTSMRWSQSPPNSTPGQLVRSPLIVGITLLASVMAAQPHWS